MPMKRKNKEHPHVIESLIAEPVALRLGLDRTKANPISPRFPRGRLSKSEAEKIEAALRAICAAPEDLIIERHGRRFKFVRPHPANPSKGTQLSSRPGSTCAAQIVVAPMDEPAQHIYAFYALLKNGNHVDGEARFFLECEGNSTTSLSFNNLLPITFRDPASGKLASYPSSSPAAMMAVNRELFYFLDDVAQQVTGIEASLFSPETRTAIRCGDFTIVHIQHACYVPTDVSPFLRILVALFAPPAATAEGFSKLAEQLGLRFDYETDPRTKRVTAVKFEKRHGKNSVFSIVFYDKRKGVSHMRQGKTLSPVESDLIDNNVRLDMTIHGPGVMQIIGDAQRRLKRLRQQHPKFPDFKFAKEFLSGTPEQTARWFEFAVYVLSHREVDGVLHRRSFADYLVPKMINEVLRLKSIVCCTVAGLQAFEKLNHPIAQAWREAEKIDPVELRTEICQLAGCGKTTLDKHRKEWLAAYHLDIAISRAFYRDLRTYSPASLILPEGRDALLAARDQQDGDETLRLLDDADGDFFSQVNGVVGRAISSPPTLLPVKVVGEAPAVTGPAAGAIAGKPSPNRGPQVQGRPPGKPASSRSASTSGQRSPVNLVSGGKPKGGRLIRGQTSLKQVARPSPPKRPPLNQRALNSRAKLERALAQTRAELRSAPTKEVRLQLQQEEDFLLEWRENHEKDIMRLKRARQEKKKAARLKRMGGPLRAPKIK